jgi:hypothetical protein
MTLPHLPFFCKAGFTSLLALGMCSGNASAEWQRDLVSISWVKGTNVFWRFSFDPTKGKPFFHPVAPAGGTPLTNFKPSDHPWHYGLWFSWKYINHPGETNHVNYWEEDRTTGNAQGKTSWKTPTIRTKSDGSATIQMNLSYINPSKAVDMTEARELKISAPAADGSFVIDWTARFTVGKQDVILDRTPMLGEPDGQVNGGYAGLAARMIPLPVTMSAVTTAGPVEQYVSNRARPNAAAVACNFSDGTRDLGGLAFFSDPANTGGEAPWYIVSSQQMPFICESLLAPKPRAVAAHAKFDLHYRIAVSPKAWTQSELQSLQTAWLKPAPY